jgi:hypothetical protein
VRSWAVHPVQEDTVSQAFFQASIACILGDATLFWCDSWLCGQCIGALLPELVDAIPARAQLRQMVASTLTGVRMDS